MGQKEKLSMNERQTELSDTWSVSSHHLQQAYIELEIIIINTIRHLLLFISHMYNTIIH